MRYELAAGPVIEPVSLGEAKLHCRVDHDAEDDLILSLIQAAREEAEGMTSRVLAPQTWTARLDSFPAGGEIEIAKFPVQSVTSITYVDPDGGLQTLDASKYSLDAGGVVPRIRLAYGESWPAARREAGAVRILFVAGYDEVPSRFRSWMLLRIGELYAFRERSVTGTVIARLNADSLVLADRVGF